MHHHPTPLLDRELVTEALAPGGRFTTNWANNVKAARLARGWKHEELAVRCGVNPSTIFRLEKGQIKFSLYMICAISAAFGTRQHDMFPFPDADTLNAGYLAA